jgi:hypothetical protein
VEEESTTQTTKRKGRWLSAETTDIRAERKLNRDVTVHSKLTTTLVPVPMPLRLEPSRSTTVPGS